MKYIQLFYMNIILIFSKITLKFSEYENKSYLKPDFNFLKDYFENTSFYTNITIGTPKQIIPSYIYIENSNFYIDRKKRKEYFQYKKSTSYKKLENESKYISDEFTKGILSSDILYLDSNIIKNCNFILSTVGSRFKFTKFSAIGLKTKNISYNFINQLKQNNFINSDIFTIKFNEKNSNEGEIIIGDYPHNYDINYKNKKFNFDKAILKQTLFYWNLFFDDIYIKNNKNLVKNINIGITLDFNGFFGDKNYHDYIYENIFKKLISEKKCFKNFDDDYKIYYYYCNKDSNIEKKFENIYFKSKKLDYIFELNFKDVFKMINNKLYFLIVFSNNLKKEWVLGNPFLKKYQIIFNQEESIIGFYNDKIKLQNGILIITGIFFIMMIILFIIQYCKVRDREVNRRKYGQKENEQELNYIEDI